MHVADSKAGEYTEYDSDPQVINHWVGFMQVLPAALAALGKWVNWHDLPDLNLILLNSILFLFTWSHSASKLPPLASFFYHLAPKLLVTSSSLCSPLLLILTPSFFIPFLPPIVSSPAFALLSGRGPVCKMPPLQRRTQLRGEMPRRVTRRQQFHLQIRQGQQRVSSVPRQLHPGVREGWRKEREICLKIHVSFEVL